MIVRFVTVAAVLFVLNACNAETKQPAMPNVAPGTYSNIATAPDGSRTGIELAVAETADGKTASLMRCDQRCGDPETHPVRTGLGGISFELDSDDAGSARQIAMAQPDGDGIDLTIGAGVDGKSYRLSARTTTAAPTKAR